jgi:deazaflavin-dependent oxidoreductase (nitroreductase family)
MTSAPSQSAGPPRLIIAFITWLDKTLLRLFDYSLLATLLAKQTKMPVVATFILITKGRRSGKWIEIPIYYYRDGDNYAVIGSKGGAPQHPAWFLNLEADPVCKFHVNRKTYNARARLAAGEERERIWAHAAKLYPPYTDYQKSAGARQIPVVVLEPTS